MKQSSIVYRPSIIACCARVVLPVLQFICPASVYRWVYNNLYSLYRLLLRWRYGFRIFKAHLSRNEKMIAKTRLTRQLLPYTMGGYKALENAFEVVALAEERRIEGAIVECGVAEGGTAAMMALTSRLYGGEESRAKWFFDSYEGLPDPTPEDYENGRAGHFVRPLPKGSCLGTIEQVSNLLFNNLGFEPGEISLVKGWFQQTIPANHDKVGKVAILRLDGDWYESTKIPLDYFYHQVSRGGFIIVDDYATCFGSRKAVDEFLQEHDIQTSLIPDGRGGIWFEKNI